MGEEAFVPETPDILLRRDWDVFGQGGEDLSICACVLRFSVPEFGGVFGRYGESRDGHLVVCVSVVSWSVREMQNVRTEWNFEIGLRYICFIYAGCSAYLKS